MDIWALFILFLSLYRSQRQGTMNPWYSQASHIRGDVCGYISEREAPTPALWFRLHLMDPLRLGAIVTSTFTSWVPSSGNHHRLQLESSVSLRAIVCGQHSQQQARKHTA
jgi:hypothetical protein